MTYREAMALAEREYLARLLASHRWNVTQAVSEARVNRTQFYRILKRHGLRRPLGMTYEISPTFARLSRLARIARVYGPSDLKRAERFGDESSSTRLRGPVGS